jgi:Family of unknown function (DUF5329)
MKIRSSTVLALALVIAPVARAEPPAIVKQEINHLLQYIGDSGCDFKRNGIWSNAKTAEAHVRSKYDFLARLGRIDTTKDFIDKAATESSLSGQPYEIKCGGDSPMLSNPWLSNELVRHRASQQSFH